MESNFLISQGRRLRTRELKSLVQGHTGGGSLWDFTVVLFLFLYHTAYRALGGS